MLMISNLTVEVDGKMILNGLNLEVKSGEVHAIMGPNGSGKSTLANVIAGRDGYNIIEGSIHYQKDDLLELSAEERARQGLFLAFQYPVEIPGVANVYFLKEALNSIRISRGEEELDAIDFLKLAKAKLDLLEMKEEFLYRSVNEGFSGGEKKRNEVFQMAMLEPTLSLLDETDSGLDIDALKVVANGINSLRNASRSFVLVTHYQRLLEYIIPDKVHVLAGGKVIKSGGRSLAIELEEKGYGWIDNHSSDSDLAKAG